MLKTSTAAKRCNGVAIVEGTKTGKILLPTYVIIADVTKIKIRIKS
jgi:hypothetical protein